MSRGAPKVLVVDSRKELREALKDALGLSFHVSAARSAEGALAAVETYRPRVVLACETQSGELDGLELCRQIRSRSEGKDRLLVVYGGQRMDSDATKANYLLDEYLGKDVTIKQIDELLRKHLRLGWVPMASEKSGSDGDDKWKNPMTDGSVVSARKGEESAAPKSEEGTSWFSRLFRRS